MAAVSPERLGGIGLTVHVPPFTFRIRSRNSLLSKALITVYADYSTGDESCFIDYDLAVTSTDGLRRWMRPLVNLEFDGVHPFAPLPATQAFPLLEWAMNWCVTTGAHQYLMCHSAVLAKGTRAVILPAPPGSGKSTLCAALMMSGWRLLSDELALIDPETVEITPFVRPISLKNESIPIIQAHFPSAVMTDPVKDTIKGTVSHMRPTSFSLDHACEKASPAWLVFPRYVRGGVLERTEIGKAEAVVELAKNAFNLPILGSKGMNALVATVAVSDCVQINYGNLAEILFWFDTLERGASVENGES